MVLALWFLIGCVVGAVVTWKWAMWAVKQALAADKARTQRWIDGLPVPRGAGGGYQPPYGQSPINPPRTK